MVAASAASITAELVIAPGAAARPALAGADPAEELPLLAERRDPLYAEIAGVELDCRGKSVGEVVKAVLAHIGGSAARGCRA